MLILCYSENGYTLRGHYYARTGDNCPLKNKAVQDKSNPWYRLDNAAKLYPAIRNRKWMSIFRVSVLLNEPVKPLVLQEALETTLARIPSFALKMRTGFFWYYFEPNPRKPLVQEDVQNPCMRFTKANRGYLFRVRYYNRRIALEVFHAVTDGTGAMTFLKTLTAEYLRLMGHKIPAGEGILDPAKDSKAGEMEDAFSRYARFKAHHSRKESKAYSVRGTVEPMLNLNITTGLIPLERITPMAKKQGVSLTEFIVAMLLISLNKVQLAEGNRRLRPVKVSVPVNLRKYYESESLRNFSMFVNPGIDPNFGEYTLEEVCQLVHHFLRYEMTEKHLNARLARNVQSERNPVVRAMPLFAKNAAIRMIFHYTGESRFTSTFSNIGIVSVPEEMKKYVERFDFVLGPSRYNRVNCTATSYGGTLALTFSRVIREAMVEREFFTMLVKMGVPVKIESNQE